MQFDKFVPSVVESANMLQAVDQLCVCPWSTRCSWWSDRHCCARLSEAPVQRGGHCLRSMLWHLGFLKITLLGLLGITPASCSTVQSLNYLPARVINPWLVQHVAGKTIWFARMCTSVLHNKRVGLMNVFMEEVSDVLWILWLACSISSGQPFTWLYLQPSYFVCWKATRHSSWTHESTVVWGTRVPSVWRR